MSLGWDVSNTDEHDRITGVTTTSRLSMPVTTPTVDAWHAADPNGLAPSAELDAAFDTDVYGPAWRMIDEVGRRLERLGFHRDADYRTGSSLQTRGVTLTRDGVTVWLAAEYPVGRVSVYRNW